MTGFPHDPDLDPVGPSPLQAQPAATPGRLRPVIAPAEPDRWSTAVSLDFPLTVDGERLDSITVRCLTGEAFVEVTIANGGNEETLTRDVRAAMCGVHPDVIAALHPDDHARVVNACGPFLPAPLRADPDSDGIVASVYSVGA